MNRLRGLALALLLLLALVKLGYDRGWLYANPSAQAQALAPTKQTPSTQEPATREAMLEKLAQRYRLQPDRRVLMAVGAIDAFFSKQEAQTAQASFRNGQWQIIYRDQSVGNLPELPDFAQQLEFLIQYARQRQQQAGIITDDAPIPAAALAAINADLDAFYDRHSAQAANKLGAQWAQGNHSIKVLRLATKALAQLQLQQFDEMQLAEHISTQSLALLAITRSGGTSMPQEEALIAYEMDYTAHARQLLGAPKDDDALSAYVFDQGEALSTVAARSTASAMDRYLNLLALAHEGRAEKWFRAFAREHANAGQAPMALAKAAVKLNASHAYGVAPLLPQFVVVALNSDQFRDTLEQRPHAAGKSLENITGYLDRVHEDALRVLKPQAGTLAQYMDKELAALPARYDGPFLPGKVYADQFRGYFYSGLYLHGLYWSDFQSSTDATKRFLAELSDSKEASFAPFKRWYEIIAQASAERIPETSFPGAVADAAKLSAPAALRVLKAQQEEMPFGSPAYIQSVRALVTALDWRPGHRAEMATLFREALLDPFEARRLGESAVALNPRQTQQLAIYLAEQRKDIPALQSLANTSATYHRIKAVEALERLKAISPEARLSTYAAVVKDDADNVSSINLYVDALIDARRYREARQISTNWLDRNPNYPGLWPVQIQEDIARTYRLEGKWAEANKLAAYLTETMKGSALGEAMQIYEAQSNWEAAERVGMLNVERYPASAYSRSRLAGFYWRHNQPEKAAALLGQKQFPANELTWRDKLGPAFTSAFEGKTDEVALAAYQHLVQSGVDHANLRGMANAAANAKRPALAVAMIEPLRFPGFGQFSLYALQYHYQKRSEGEDIALSALKQKIPQQWRNPFSMLAYDIEEFPLLWSIIDDPKGGEYPEAVWLSRANAALLIGDAAHLKEARDYFAQNPTGHYQTLGRYLTGLADEREIIKLIDSPKHECEVTYALGVRALASGNKMLAVQWFRLAIETLSIRDGEYRWAYDQLHTWYTNGIDADAQLGRGWRS